MAVELNPVNETNNPTKRRGLIIKSEEDLREYEQIFNSDKLHSLVKSVEAVNPAEKRRVAKPEDVKYDF